MKQIELELTITNTDDNKWEIFAKPKNFEGNKLVSWYKGDSKEQVLKKFYEGMSEPYIRYWFMLEEKDLTKS
jgi:hypothetical protein